MKSRKRHELELTAHHEAGHAVVSYVLKRRKIRYVSIIPSDQSLGHVLFGDPDKEFHPDISSDSKTRVKIEKEIMICLAGDAAENILKNRDIRNVVLTDYCHAVDFACHASGDPDEAGAYVNWLYYRARNILRQPWHWDASKALAGELMVYRKLGPKRVYEIIKQSVEGWGKGTGSVKG